jgi:hypothetical protein
MISQVFVAFSLLVLPAASVEKTVHLFDGAKSDGCDVLDSTYTGTDLLTSTSCKQVASDSVAGGKHTVWFKYVEGETTLKFQVLHHETCDNLDEMAVVVEASEAESAKILLGECGEVSLYVGDDKSFQVKMYMKITDASEALTISAAPATAAPATAAPATAAPATAVGEGTHTIQLFQEEGEGCTVIDTTYIVPPVHTLMRSTSCETVVSDSQENGRRNAGFKCLSEKRVKFKVHDTCDDIHGMAVVMEADDAESAKILAGECGEVTSYFGDDEGTKSFMIKMYMKITPAVAAAAAADTATEKPNTIEEEITSSTTSAADASTSAPTTAAAASARTAVADQAERTNIVMPIVSVVMSVMLLAC